MLYWETDMQKQRGRPPITGKRLPNPHNVRYDEETMATAREIAHDHYGDNVSYALRWMARMGMLAYRMKEATDNDDDASERSGPD